MCNILDAVNKCIEYMKAYSSVVLTSKFNISFQIFEKLLLGQGV